MSVHDGLRLASLPVALGLTAWLSGPGLAAENGAITVVLSEEPDIIDPCEASRSNVGRVVKQNITETLTEILAVARVYPARNLGLYFKGGAGIGVSTTSVEFGDSNSESGFATSLGAGYEIKVSDKLFITPALDYYLNRFEKRGEDTLYERLWNLSVGVTWQPGR